MNMLLPTTVSNFSSWHRLLLSLSVCFLFSLANATVTYAAARLELSPSTGQIQSGGTTIVVSVNADGNQLKSTTAVLTYDETKVSVTAVKGTYFPDISIDASVPGEIVVTGTLGIGNTTGVTGTGTLATLTATPTSGATGTVSMQFICNQTDVDDSNIISVSDENLLSTTAQCANNVSGSYTLGTTTGSSGSSGGTGGTTQPKQCNQSCTATSECQSGLSCLSGSCRNASCTTATNCICSGNDIAAAQGATTLPETASIGESGLLIGLGSLFSLGGLLLLLHKRQSLQQQYLNSKY